MPAFKRLFTKRICLTALLISLITIVFWTQSRVPALNEKSMMGDRTVFSGLAFEQVVVVNSEDMLVKRVAASSLNWAYTNWKGMAFGLLLAAAALVLFNLLPKQRSSNYFINAFKGVVGGAPLGVCVNCTTPIAQGMHKAGIRLETVLATLISSPTLNVIVLSMSFSILPIQYAVIKVVSVLIMVLIVVPIIVRTFYRKQDIDLTQEHAVKSSLADTPFKSGILQSESEAGDICAIPEAHPISETWFNALSYVAQQYFVQLRYILRVALPFMLLAGVLGAFLLEVLPSNLLTELPFSLATLFIIALIGTFLPVPIAFDVIVVSVLLSAGIDVGYGMALLFALGSFSIYPMMVIAKNISSKIAGILFISTVALSVSSAGVLKLYEGHTFNQVLSAHNNLNDRYYSQALKIGEEVCQYYSTKQKQNGCIGEFVLQQFSAGADKSLCEHFTGDSSAQLKQSCLVAYQYKAKVAEAVTNKDISVCKTINPALQQRCEDEFVVGSLAREASLSVCDQLSHPKAKEACHGEVLRRRLSRYGGIGACSIVTGKEKVVCLDNVAIKNAARGGATEDCLQLPSKGLQNHCLFSVVAKKAKDELNTEHCNSLSILGQKKLCYNEVLRMIAISGTDLGLCEQLNNASSANKCKSQVIKQLIVKKLSEQRLADTSLLSGISELPIVEPVVPLELSPPLELSQFYQEDNITVESRAHLGNRLAEGQSYFKRRADLALELEPPSSFSINEFREPFSMGRGITAGDFNNDGWPDIVFASSLGPVFYQNTGGHFSRLTIDFTELPALNTFDVALLDIDNDGWLDLFASTYGGRNYFLINDREGFKKVTIKAVDNPNAILTISSGFADIDRDGDIDGLFGNWSFGSEGRVPTRSQNLLFKSEDNHFSYTKVSEVKGETLSILMSDLNGDKVIDVLVANDFSVPDHLYLNIGLQSSLPKFNAGLLPLSSLNTMSLESADFNNDGLLDIFSVDMSFGEGYQGGYCDSVKDNKAHCEMLLAGRTRIERRDTPWCQSLKPADKLRCLRAVYRDVAITAKDPQLCGHLRQDKSTVDYEFCLYAIEPRGKSESFRVDSHIKQIQRNVLLMASREGFVDKAEEMGVAESYWSWNAKAADLDNDGWQDIYVANGIPHTQGSTEIHSNVFYHNHRGNGFTQSEKEFGLEDYINTPGYVYIDYDLDGDMDIVSTATIGPVRVFENRESTNHSITIELRDDKGNRFGIGSKLKIKTADGMQQIREIKSSGGFLSHEASIVHFGLGQETKIESIEVEWSTGQSSIINKPLLSDHHYIIRRGL